MRWPEKETVADTSQGVQLATMQELARYWATDYDWRKVEARLNALPQFMTEIDGLDIHFIHVRSQHENALPLIVTHGWPGSIIEQLKIIEPLTDPTAHGGSAEDAFHVVIPSLPGHGFSGKPTTTGWDPIRIARAWIVLMQRLGYDRYVAQGGDWGNAVTEQMALQKPPGLLGIHTNMPATLPEEIRRRSSSARRRRPVCRPRSRARGISSTYFYKHGLAYAQEMGNRPQTLYAIADSPVGLAAWMLDHDARSYELIARVFAGESEGLTRDDILDNVTLYWLTNTGGLVGAAVLGKQAGLLCPQGRHPPGGSQRLSRRDLFGAAELDRASLSQPDPLQPAAERRALRGVGAAAGALRRAPRHLPLAALSPTGRGMTVAAIAPHPHPFSPRSGEKGVWRGAMVAEDPLSRLRRERGQGVRAEVGDHNVPRRQYLPLSVRYVEQDEP